MASKIQATKMDLDFKDGEVDRTNWKKKFEDEMEKQRNKDGDPDKKKKPAKAEKGIFAKSKSMSSGTKANNEFSTDKWTSKKGGGGNGYAIQGGTGSTYKGRDMNGGGGKSN
jgi:hypothetical protein